MSPSPETGGDSVEEAAVPDRFDAVATPPLVRTGRVRDHDTQVKGGIFRSELSRLIRPDHLLEDLRSMEEELGPRAAAVNRRLEIPVLLTALAVFPMFLLELAASDGWPVAAAAVVNWLIWAAFTVEFVLLFSLTHHRAAYLRRAWLHLSVIPFAFPMLMDVSSGSGLEGVFRFLRFVVLVVVFVHSCMTLFRLMKHLFFDLLAVVRHPRTFVLRPLLRMRGLGLVVLVFCGLAVVAGLIHSVFEERHPIDGMWWALVTLTTVGYGDITPVTVGGRITGAVLMLSGIGVLAFTTASVAAFFVEGDHKEELHEEVQSVNQRLDATNERLDRIEELLSSGMSPTVTTDPDD